MSLPSVHPVARIELTKALRILEAERRDGYQDRMVRGGLSGYLGHFVEQVASATVGDQARTIVGPLASYGSLSPADRAAHLDQTLAELRALLDELSPADHRDRPSAGGHPDGAGRTRPTPLQPSPRQQPVPGTRPRAQPPAATAFAHSAPRTAGQPLSRVQPLPAAEGISLDTPIQSLKGIGPQRARLYTRLDLRTVRDLLFHFPLRHLPYPPACPIGELLFQMEGSVVGTLERLEIEDLSRGLKRLRATIRDTSGVVFAVWLRHGLPQLGVKPGDRVAISGKLLQHGRQLTFDNPDFERGDAPPIHTRGLVPVYPLTARLHDKELRGRIHWAVGHFAESLDDPLPAAMREQHRLLPLGEALRTLHFPTSAEAYEQARQRFAFQELFTIQLVVLQRKASWQQGSARPLPRHTAALEAFARHLPFNLTGAQKRVVEEILRDLEQPRPMTRLVQGEVGSGKTAVAAMALVNALAHGTQGALMAPTEILAEQHFTTLSRLFESAGEALTRVLGHRPTVRLLTGSTRGKERDAILTGAQDGSVDVLVGTQALIQERVRFARLGLAVVDEQHRFGVKQRDALRERAGDSDVTPHLLVMTATPIPRTLALTQHGDLDLSIIDELPPGRQTIKTVLVGPEDRNLAYERVRRAVGAGRQAFIICPLVEESEALEAKAATDEYERLRTGELAGLRLALLHGRMKPAEKDAIMRAFRDHESDVLVSTAVVEVGVDVPNATVMMIEGAERFGLAQIHQFRGRVGRGEHPSVCILLTDHPEPQTIQRLRVATRSANGLELAEHDLRLRGPGDYLGVRQSGFPELKAAQLSDAPLISGARAAAETLLAADPTLEAPHHSVLRRHLEEFMARIGEPS